MSDNYRNYLNKWLSGLYDEIKFWNEYMEHEGGIYNCGFQRTVQKNRKFVLEDELPKQSNGEEVKFIDIGSGPFSRCGTSTEKVKLKVTAIDPLGDIYRILKQNNKLENGLKVETGFVELLDKKFFKNSFDLVHMSNALDHSFDPVFGIYQMLYICKIGGKVILRHTENEAENENYQGLHQWNLSVHNKENSFIVWRMEERMDICRIFRECADITVYPDIQEDSGTWIYNKVVMEKKKDIEIPSNMYYDDIFSIMYGFLTKTLFENVCIGTGNRKSIHNRLLKEKIANIRVNPDKFKSKLLELSIDNVDIYGFGIVGRELYELLMEIGINIVHIIDKRQLKYGNLISITPSDYKDEKKSINIIVTVADEFDEIALNLYNNGFDKNKIIKVEDLIGVNYG